MGWYSGYFTRRELIAELLTPKAMDEKSTRWSVPLAHCYRGNPITGGILWSVWEVTLLDGSKERYILCDKIKKWRTNEWAYKSMEESMHPYFYSCPLRYLDMVPETNSGINVEWRQKVREYHENRRNLRKISTKSH